MTRARAQKAISDWLYQRGPARYYQSAYRAIAEAVTVEGGRILDIGCGPGWLSVHISRHGAAAEAVGIDHSAAMVRAARQNAQSDGNVHILQMSAAELEFSDGSFDAVSAVQTAHHWKEPGVILKEMHRVVVDGGSCYLYEADRSATGVPESWIDRRFGWPPDRVVMKGWKRFGMNADEWSTMETLAHSAGFRDVQSDHHGFYRRLVMTK